tara:strand:+ start:40 stop:543 length:504 start_codon:yes stop_codon:yes gene_type:complete
MLIVKTISGNIHNNTIKEKIEKAKINGNVHKLFLSRIELEKLHTRKMTNDGLEVGLSFESGVKLHDGDVLDAGSVLILVKQTPEKIIHVKFKNDNFSSNLAVLVGHVIGNRHRPISTFNDGSIAFPIHDDSELELFHKLFQDTNEHLILNIEETIFVPNETMNVHEH